MATGLVYVVKRLEFATMFSTPASTTGKKPPNGKGQNEPFAHFVDVVGSLLHFACNVPLFCVSGLKNGSNCNSAAKGECTASCTGRGKWKNGTKVNLFFTHRKLAHFPHRQGGFCVLQSKALPLARLQYLVDKSKQITMMDGEAAVRGRGCDKSVKKMNEGAFFVLPSSARV